MADATSITTFFLDIGGVLLTNGWDRHMRRAAAEKFALDFDEMDERHHLTFDTYEEGKLSLDEYLDRVIFHKPRPFSRDAFREHMFQQSRPCPEMMSLVRELKSCYSLRTAAVSNEGRELTVHRVREFNLKGVIDLFVCSCFLHCRKPDEEIYRFAIDLCQVEPEHVVYIDDRELFTEVARSLGIKAIRHTDFESTRSALADLGLVAPS